MIQLSIRYMRHSSHSQEDTLLRIRLFGLLRKRRGRAAFTASSPQTCLFVAVGLHLIDPHAHIVLYLSFTSLTLTFYVPVGRWRRGWPSTPSSLSAGLSILVASLSVPFLSLAHPRHAWMGIGLGKEDGCSLSPPHIHSLVSRCVKVFVLFDWNE